jgi:hypothetical protein
MALLPLMADQPNTLSVGFSVVRIGSAFAPDLDVCWDPELGCQVSITKPCEALALRVALNSVEEAILNVGRALFLQGVPGVSQDARQVHGTKRESKGSIASQRPVASPAFFAATVLYAVSTDHGRQAGSRLKSIDVVIPWVNALFASLVGTRLMLPIGLQCTQVMITAGSKVDMQAFWFAFEKLGATQFMNVRRLVDVFLDLGRCGMTKTFTGNMTFPSVGELLVATVWCGPSSKGYGDLHSIGRYIARQLAAGFGEPSKLILDDQLMDKQPKRARRVLITWDRRCALIQQYASKEITFKDRRASRFCVGRCALVTIRRFAMCDAE